MRGFVLPLAGLALLCTATFSRAAPIETSLGVCIDRASHHYKLDPTLVRAVLRQEGGGKSTVSRNDNGTVDLGPMQINSIHLPELAKYGISRDLLVSNPCLNVYIGAWMLKREISQAKDVWTGIGNYHSHTPYHNAKYQWLIWRRLQQVRSKR